PNDGRHKTPPHRDKIDKIGIMSTVGVMPVRVF
ncbi:MAG: hypothetical protein ACI93T_000529, partial [Porticoccaceae bacterium]